ncbi:MAG TPA: S1/P1 nuclease, partial [Tepidisphaeraceae bacterium]|nr:S1/P1 nuclease [Tepidisphaeraceae bacterium]
GYVAYHQLTPQTRAVVDRILRAHPYYEADLLSNMPAHFEDPALWAFMTACSWPDMLRSQAHPMHRAHHRGPWHYINIPFVQPDDDPATMRVEPAGPMQYHPHTDPENAVQALYLLAGRLQDASIPDHDKAIWLCWYLHLGGDIHQPLHATTRFSKQHPTGDRGGNSIFFTVDNTPINLHAYWDNLAGRYDNPRVLALFGDALRTHRTDIPRVEIDPDNLSYALWARESFEVAVRYVYWDGELSDRGRNPGRRPARASTQPTTAPSDRMPETDPAPDAGPPPLPDGYAPAATEIGHRRIALSGRRMGSDLNHLLAPRSDAPAGGE